MSQGLGGGGRLRREQGASASERSPSLVAGVGVHRVFVDEQAVLVEDRDGAARISRRRAGRQRERSAMEGLAGSHRWVLPGRVAVRFRLLS